MPKSHQPGRPAAPLPTPNPDTPRPTRDSHPGEEGKISPANSWEFSNGKVSRAFKRVSHVWRNGSAWNHSEPPARGGVPRVRPPPPESVAKGPDRWTITSRYQILRFRGLMAEPSETSMLHETCPARWPLHLQSEIMVHMPSEADTKSNLPAFDQCLPLPSRFPFP